MKSESLAILKSVSSKLANCKGRVPASKLIEFMKQGKFGFSASANKDTVVTNDSIFADEVQNLISHLRLIFKEPYINLEKQKIVQNVSVATQFDNHSLRETYLDESLWRVRNGVAAPEFIHTYVNEENLAIYENRFICFLIDLMFDVVSKKLSALYDGITTFNSKIDPSVSVNKGYSANKYATYNKEKGIPVLASSSDPTAMVIGSLMKSKTALLSFKNTELYKSCAKLGKFDYQNLKATNILMHANNYNYCYEFFLRYLTSNKNVTTQDKMYLNYGVVSTFQAIESLGYAVEGDVVLSSFADVKLDGVSFTNDLFTLTVKKLSNSELELTVTENADKNSAKYLLAFVDESVKEAVCGKDSVSEYIRKLNLKLELGYYNAYVITNVEGETGDKVLYLDPIDKNAYEKIVELIASLTVLAEGVDYIHSRNCPICGSKLVAPDGSDIVCSNCNTIYHIFTYEFRQYIWFKHLPDVDEGKRGVVESEEILMAEAKENRVQRYSLKKSFMGKLSQSTVEQKAYYNEIKNLLLSYKKINSRVSWNYDSFNLGREKKVKIAFRGKTLVAFFALDPEKYSDSKYFPHDKGDVKKFEDTPMMVKIKTERSKNRALELVEILLGSQPKKKDYVNSDYSLKYMSDKKLIEQGLAKETLGEKGLPLEINAKETVATKVIDDDTYIVEETVPGLRESISKSFTAKLCQASADQKKFYGEIKNALLEYKRVNSRISWSYDSFNLGREKKAKIAFRGKTMVIYLALNPDDYEGTKYYTHNVGGVKKFEDTPMMIKIKSARGVKHAIELIGVMLDGVVKVKDFVPETYKFSYKSDKKLIEEGLAKKVMVKDIF